MLRLGGEFSISWNNYIEELRKGYIRIREIGDELGWSMNRF
jgi:hypothetical protein